MPLETFLGRLKVKVTLEGHKLACLGHNPYIYAWISK